MPAIEMTRQNLRVSQLRVEAVRSADAKQARRILATAMGLDGHSRRLAAPAVGVGADGDDARHRDDAAGLADLHVDRIDPKM